MKKILVLSVPPTKEHAPSNSGGSFSSYSLDEFKALDADKKKGYTCYLTDLYNNDRSTLLHIVNKTGFLTLDCSSIKSLELKEFELNSLNLSGCQNLSSLEKIQHLTNLNSIYLSGCQNLSSLEGIQSLTNLNSLSLSGCQNLSSLEGVKNITTLNSLSLSGCQNLSSLEGVQYLTNLTSLSLSGCQNLSSLEGVKHLTNLNSLHLSGCQNLSSLEGVQQLTNLNSLTLQGCQNLSSLESLQYLTKLNSLALAGCQNLSSLEGIKYLTNLNSLSLSGCQNLPTIEGIQRLATLSSLTLSGYQHPIDLSRLSSLVKLHLEGCSIEASISETLNNLETLQLSNSRFPINSFLDSLLLRAPNLKTISFLGKKHTYSEYARLLGALSRIKNEPYFIPQKILFNQILQDIHQNPFILPMDNSMALYHVYLLILFARDCLSDEQKESLTESLIHRLTDHTNTLDLCGIWSIHRIGSLLGVSFDLSAYNDTFTSQLQQLGLEKSHQLHEILGSNTELESHIETLSAAQVESSDLQDQLTSDGVFSGIETKLKKLGISTTITQEALAMGHRLDIVVKIKGASGNAKSINIELDGDHHRSPNYQAKDAARDHVLEQAGYHVIRISNTDLSKSDMTINNKVDFIIAKLTPLLPEIPAPKVTNQGGSSHERGSTNRGRGTRGRRDSQRR